MRPAPDAGSPPRKKSKAKRPVVRVPPRKAADPTPEPPKRTRSGATRPDAPNQVRQPAKPRPPAPARPHGGTRKPGKHHGSAERLGRTGSPLNVKGPANGVKGAPIRNRRFENTAELEAYVERLEDKREARKQGYADARHQAAESTKKLGSPAKVKAFRERTKELREQAVKDATQTKAIAAKENKGPGGKGPLPHRSASEGQAIRDADKVLEQKLADAPKQARSELGTKRKKSDPVRKRAQARGRARVRARVKKENAAARELDHEEIRAQGYVTGSRHDKGLEAGAKVRERKAAEAAVKAEKDKRRGGGAGQLVTNARDEVKDTIAGFIPGLKESAEIVAENAGGLVEAVAHPARSKAKGDTPTPKTTAMAKEIEKTSPAIALMGGDVKEALGRAKERPFNALGEAIIVAAPVTKGAQATQAAARVRKRGDKATTHNVREEMRAARGEKLARAPLVAEQDAPHKPSTPAGKAKAKAKVKKARTDAKARARAAARGEIHERPKQEPGTVSSGDRRYSVNAAVRAGQRAADATRARGGRDPNTATGRKAARVRKRDFDKRVRNLQAAGIGREEAVMAAVREAHEPLETRSAPHRALRGRGGPARAAEAAVELLVNGRVRLNNVVKDLEAVRATIDAHDSEHRNANLALVDELLDDARGGEGIFRDPDIRRAGRLLAKESRKGDASQARTGYGDPEALEFVRLLQGPAARGEVVRRGRTQGGENGKGGGGNPTPPGWRTSKGPPRSIVSDVAPPVKAAKGVTVGERGGGMNPGEQGPKIVRGEVLPEEIGANGKPFSSADPKGDFEEMTASEQMGVLADEIDGSQSEGVRDLNADPLEGAIKVPTRASVKARDNAKAATKRRNTKAGGRKARVRKPGTDAKARVAHAEAEAGRTIQERVAARERGTDAGREAPEPGRTASPKGTPNAARHRLKRAVEEVDRELALLDELPPRGAVREAVESERGLAGAVARRKNTKEGTRARAIVDAQVKLHLGNLNRLIDSNSAVRQRAERKKALVAQRKELRARYEVAPTGENRPVDGDNVGGNLRPGEDERRQGWEGMVPGEPDPGKRPAGQDPKLVSAAEGAKSAARDREKAVEKSGQEADVRLRADVQKLQGLIDEAPALRDEHPDEPLGEPEGERSWDAEMNATLGGELAGKLDAADAPDLSKTDAPAAKRGVPSGTRAPTPAKPTRGGELVDEDGNWRWQDARTGEPIRTAEQLRAYHDDDDAGFVRGSKREHSQDRTIGSPTAGRGYELDDLLGPLGDGRARDSALERERRTTLRQLDDAIVGTHARRGVDGEVLRFQDPEKAAKQAPKGWVALKHRPERGDAGGDSEWILVPEFMAKRIESQVSSPGRLESTGRLASRIAVRATLPFSVLWHAGNTVDLMTRLALTLTPEELAKSGEVAAALERNLEKLSPELRAEVLSSLKGHFGSRETVRDPRLSNVIDGKIMPDGTRGRVRKSRTTGPSRAAQRSDRMGDAWKNNPVARFTDRVFNISSEIEQALATGRLPKSQRRVPNALGASAIRFARELGHHVDDIEHVAKAVADELAGAKDARGGVEMNHPAILRMQDEVLSIIGDFSTRSPAERKVMAGVDVYWTWLRESTRFVLKTLPEKHPKKTALLFMAASWTAEERMKSGVNYYWSDEELDRIRQHMPEVPERVEGYLAGALGGADSVVPTAGLTSFGEVAGNLLEPRRLAGRLGSYAARPAAAAMGYYRTPQEVALRALPDDVPLGIGEGEPEDLLHHGDSAARAKEMVAESTIPGLKQVRIARERGQAPHASSTVIKPKIRNPRKPGTTGDAVNALLNPARRQPRNSSEPPPTIQPRGPSYTITYVDPDTGERVTQRIARKR